MQKNKYPGLSKNEVIEQQKKFGQNKLTVKEKKWFHILGNQFKSSFIYLLFAAAVLSFFLDGIIDAIFIAIFILVNTLLGFWQEWHSEHSLQMLKKFITEKTHVIRNTEIELIDVIDIVPDDILILKAGDKIPADVLFLETKGLMIDESILTGESAPVAKSIEASKQDDQANKGFSGTMLVNGEAIARVTAIGNQTEVGKITKTTLETETTHSFQREMNQFSSFILKMVLITIAVVFLLQMLIHHDTFSFGTFIIFAIALAVGVIPEALPLVITTALSKGSLILARKKVIPRRLSAIEDLGNIDILCTDKTGTITENKMQVKNILGTDKTKILKYALAASAFLGEKNNNAASSFDTALWDNSDKNIREDCKQISLLQETPFDPERRRNNALIEENSEKMFIVRGAPEEVLPLCPELAKLENERILKQAETEGFAGCRVLAIAIKKIFDSKKDFDLINEEKNLQYLGLISFYDPLKESAPKALQEAKLLGVKVKIITGDSAFVAGAVAHEVKLVKSPTDVITGSQWQSLAAEKKCETANNYEVFARISPLQKLEIINCLKDKHTVGFLGEGFNDTPALKTAHVALVVSNASDIAKDVADIVLLNSSLEVIIDGIKEGRRIFVNSFKYIKATLISNFGNFYALVFASLIVTYPPMLPLQILLLNLLSDTPMISIATDNVDKKELRKPSGFQMKEVVLIATVLGLVSTAFDFAFFGYFMRYGQANLQTMWFIGSVMTELMLIFSIRKRGFFLKGIRPSNFILLLTAILIPLTIALPYTKFGQNVFSLAPQPLSFIIIGILLVIGYFITTEIVKRLYYHNWRFPASSK